MGLKFCMGITNGVFCYLQMMEEILENFDEMGCLMGTKTKWL